MRHFDCGGDLQAWQFLFLDRKSTRLNSSHSQISYAVFCLKKKKNTIHGADEDRRSAVDNRRFGESAKSVSLVQHLQLSVHCTQRRSSEYVVRLSGPLCSGA